jgi:hypothetical protein
MLQFPFEEQIPYLHAWNTGKLRHPTRRKWFSTEGRSERGTMLKLKHLLEKHFLCDVQVDLLSYYLEIGEARYPLLVEMGDKRVKVSVSI